MTSRSVARLIEEALVAHGIACSVSDEDQIVSLSEMPVGFRGEYAVGATIRDTVTLQLTIGATGPVLGDRAIWDDFGGFGADEDKALADAFSKFLLGSFHVLLAVLAGHNCDRDGTEWTVWTHGAGAWRVCDSPLVVQGGDPLSVPYAAVLESIKWAFLRLETTGLHWITSFFALVDGNMTCDIRLDGNTWQEGKAILDRWGYKPPERYVSGRHFLIALPAEFP